MDKTKCNKQLKGCERYDAPFDEVNRLKMIPECERCVQMRHEWRVVIFGMFAGAAIGIISSILTLIVAKCLGI